MKVSSETYNLIIISVVLAGITAGLGLAFGFVPAESQALVAKFVSGLAGALATLFLHRGE